MIVLRFLGNLLLALLLIVLIALLLFTGYGAIISQVWENVELAHGVKEGQWVWIDEEPIYYRAYGPEEGPPLVLVHGFEVAGGGIWYANAEALARWGVRVINVDLKGFGHSTRDASATYTLTEQATLLAKVLNELQVREATIAGQGWGSAVALRLAVEQPQFVGQLALISPLVYEQEAIRNARSTWQTVARVPYLRDMAVWAALSGGPVWRFRHREEFHDPSLLDGDHWGRMRQPTHIVGTTDALLAMLTAPEEDNLPQAIPTIGVPTLIIVGQEDARLPLASAQRLARELPDAKLITLAEAGHQVQIEKAERVNTLLTNFCLEGAR
ncbi:MAG: alpha/beta hydrolase [Chloroflexota bacterium]|nr:alpha/beta hydrolase [Chloroflexota bacterium]